MSALPSPPLPSPPVRMGVSRVARDEFRGTAGATGCASPCPACGLPVGLLTLRACSRSLRDVMTSHLTSLWGPSFNDEKDSVLGVWSTKFVCVFPDTFSLAKAFSSSSKVGSVAYALMYAGLSGMGMLDAVVGSPEFKAAAAAAKSRPELVDMKFHFIYEVNFVTNPIL